MPETNFRWRNGLFLVADGVLVAAAGLTLWFSSSPPGPGAVATAVLLLVAGAVVSLIPFFVEFYWNWQERESAIRDQLDSRQHHLAKLTAEVEAVVSAWERASAHGPATAEPSRNPAAQFEEMAQMLQQWQAQLEKREERLSAEFDRLLEQISASRIAPNPHAHVQLHEHPNATADSGPDDFDAEFTADPSPETDWDEAPEKSFDETPDEEDFPEAVPVASNAPDEMDAEIEAEAPEEPEAPAPTPRKRKSAGAKPKIKEETGISLFSTTTLIATAFIGAGNRLFIRGDGPGLSWEEGAMMQFVEIGKWSWTTADADGPIKIQVFKNDEEPDKAGVITVEPGQTVNLRPEF